MPLARKTKDNFPAWPSTRMRSTRSRSNCARSVETSADHTGSNWLSADLERLVVDEIAAICRDPSLTEAVTTEAVTQHAAEVADLRDRLRDAEAVAAKLEKTPARTGPAALQQRDLLRRAESQVAAARAALAEAEAATIPKAAARSALSQFEPVWSALVSAERAQLLRLLVERIRVDGQAGKVSFVFRASGIAALAQRAVAA